MDTLLRLVSEYGLWFVFANVLLQQLGAPLPGYPMLMVTGALAARGQLNIGALLATAVVACLIADSLWYGIGQWSGRRVLKTLCRISLSPDGCVRQTESIFTRFGPPSLLVAKFIPGFASVATALAGAMGIPRPAFLAYDAGGAVLWVGVGLLLGWLFSPAIEQIIAALARFGEWGLIALAILVAGFVAVKWWQRRRFTRQLQMTRIVVPTLAELLAHGERPLILDVRSALAREDGWIPGAIVGSPEGDDAALRAHPKDALIVVYCDCPNDVSAVLAARKLLERGYRDVRPLAGGIDAWTAQGFQLETGVAAQNGIR
ncbi:MAG: VTT domain-containing protein, partial [Pseudomonadota bacterium]|nr:VTT domain-containing protein [Pseudomonadota bacterium]